MFKEFKEFAMRGNVIDMAVGVIIGGAFGKIVTSLVDDILMPPMGLVLGKINFSNIFINLSDVKHKTVAEAKEAGDPTLNLGLFINSVMDFIIITTVIFLVVRQMNRMRRRLEKSPETSDLPETKKCKYCLSIIPMEAIKCKYCTSQLHIKVNIK